MFELRNGVRKTALIGEKKNGLACGTVSPEGRWVRSPKRHQLKVMHQARTRPSNPMNCMYVNVYMREGEWAHSSIFLRERPCFRRRMTWQCNFFHHRKTDLSLSPRAASLFYSRQEHSRAQKKITGARSGAQLEIHQRWRWGGPINNQLLLRRTPPPLCW